MIVAGQVWNYGSSLTNTAGNTADSSHNAYVVTTSGAVYKEAYDSATWGYTEGLLLTTPSSDSGIAVSQDGSKLYVGTGSGGAVVVYTKSNSTYTPTVTLTGFAGATIPVVDASDNLFVLDQAAGTLYKETYAGEIYTKSLL